MQALSSCGPYLDCCDLVMGRTFGGRGCTIGALVWGAFLLAATHGLHAMSVAVTPQLSEKNSAAKIWGNDDTHLEWSEPAEVGV